MSIRTYSKVRIRTLGVLFIALLLAGVWLVVAVFNQQFTSFDNVKLATDASGLQLPERADVKIRGVIVGEVTNVVANPGGDGAVLTLGIYPSQIKQIPSNVTASILPKTLFGEKYVELNYPDNPKSPLAAGDNITQTKLPVELENVLNDIYPLLTAIEPGQLNYTLNALADALDGRGAKLGQTITTIDSYLAKFNPQVPGLVRDLTKLASVSGTYADVVPQLAQTLRNSVTTGNTLESQQAQLHQLLQQASSFSDTATSFLNQNGQNIVDLANVSAPQLALLNQYASEFPCMLDGLANQVPRLNSAFRGYVLHINLIILPAQPRGYLPADKPVYGATNAPSCAELPGAITANHTVPQKFPNFVDGVDDHGGSLGRGDNQRVAPGFGLKKSAGTQSGLDQLLLGAGGN